MIWTKEYVKIFLLGSKTDAWKDGQWCTIVVDDSPHSAFQVLLRILGWLLAFPNGVKKTFGVELAEISIAMSFETVGNALLAKPSVKRSYTSMLSKLKAWCNKLGWDASLFGTHSMRRA